MENSINKVLNFIEDWTIGTVGDGLKAVGNGIKKILIGNTGSDILNTFSLDSLTGIFIIVAMVGVFFSMAGEKKIGTKLSSLSFVIYLILKVILAC